MLTAPPSAWVARFAGAVPPGPVLDVACGGGRHARLFLERGHAVAAIDRDLSGVADLRADPRVELLAADLEDGRPWPLAGRRFAAVVVTNYLHRPLFPALAAAVAPGGLLIYETFARGHMKDGRPFNPAFTLEPGELLAAFSGSFGMVAYEHGRSDGPRPAVVQRLAAVAGDPATVRLP